MPSLSAHALSGGYGNRAVLSEITFVLEPGEFVGVLGANGGGKSTLIRLLLGWLLPMSGEVRLDDKPLGEWTAKERARQIAYVPQGESAAFDFTVREVVAMGRYAHLVKNIGLTPADYAVIHSALETMHLPLLADRPLATLSGGEQRRVRIARALAQQSFLMLLDEPTAHLDPAHQVRLMTQLRSLVHAAEPEGRRGVLASLHDFNQAAEFCDRLLLLHAGRLLAQGTPAEVLTLENLRVAFGIEATLETNSRTGKPFVLEYRAIDR